jgi:hypothetical protein
MRIVKIGYTLYVCTDDSKIPQLADCLMTLHECKVEKNYGTYVHEVEEIGNPIDIEIYPAVMCPESKAEIEPVEKEPEQMPEELQQIVFEFEKKEMSDGTQEEF